MKKIKFLGTAILAASLLLAGCSSPVDDVVTDDDTTVTLGPEDDGNTTGGGTTTGGTTTGGGTTTEGGTTGGSNEPVINYTAPDLTGYYKNYFVSTTETAVLPGFDIWGSGTTRTINDDGSWTITPGSAWGNGVSCAAFTNIAAGTIANYEYIVFTIDTTNFSIRYGEGNDGVNVKVPEIQSDISTNCVVNGNLRTYYAPVSLFGTAPANAVEFAIIIGGTGTYKINEVYFASADDPNNRAVTGITITPSAASIAQGGTQQFTVKDSNHAVCTSGVTYSLSGEAATGSSITTAGLLTAGTTAGSLTVTATYTVNEEEFTADATITVLGAMTNLVSSVELDVYTDSAHNKDLGEGITTTGEFVTIENNIVTLNKPNDGAWGEWSCQLFLKVNASEGRIFEAGKRYYASVTVNSTASLNTCVWKEDLAGKIDQHNISYVGGEARTLTAEFDGADLDYFKCLLSFPGDASTITISDITVYDITE